MSLKESPLLRDWLAVRGDLLLLKTGKVDIGQRISTALVRIVARELAIDENAVDVAEVRTGFVPDEGVTSGSNSIEHSGRAVEAAVLTLRDAVIAKAALAFDCPSERIELRDGLLVDSGSNRSLQLVDVVRDLDPALPVNPAAAPASSVTTSQPAGPPRGMREMVTGSYRYVHDLEAQGMWHARTVRPPHWRARLGSIDAAIIGKLQDEGFRIVQDGSFLAVAGEREYPTQRAAERLARACSWTGGESLDETDIFALLRSARRQSLTVVEGKPVDAPLPAALKEVSHRASYERPYQMHGALAPSAALAEWQNGQLTVHSHSQGPYPLRASLAEAFAVETDAITVVHVPGSGCYGHNGADDAAYEAALIAKYLDATPVLLKWTRDDEHGWEPVAPAMAVDVAARMGPDQRIEAWSQEAFSDTHGGRPRPGPDRAGPRRFVASQLLAEPEKPFVAAPNRGEHAGLHRNLDPIYSFADKRLVKNLVPGLPLRTSAMRCLGAAPNTFATESFLDELAADNNIDPLEIRRRHLDDPRALEVLAGLEEHLSDIGLPAQDHGRGMAYAQYKNRQTRVAVAVDLTVSERAEVRLEHAVIAACAGRVIDRDGLIAQLEGGFLQAASWALCEAVRYDRDGVVSRDWESYRVLRFNNIPRIDVVLIDAPNDPPVGAGEASSGPTLAAIANGIFAATGLRLRRLPFTPEALQEAALSDGA